jgi:cardiolipin synthase A/B
MSSECTALSWIASPQPEVQYPVRTRGAHRAEWLLNGDQAYAAMIGAIENAHHSVRLESYLVRRGGPAIRILNALHRARERGVSVRVMIDAYGSEELPHNYFSALEATGAEVRVFNPRRLLRLSFRNHRKLLVCDERLAIIGGFNIGPEYEGDGHTRGWYDLGLELRGPVVRTLATSFDSLFELAPFTATAARAFRERQAYAEPTGGRVRMLASGPGCHPRGELRRALYRDLRRAKDISIMAAYFLPSGRIRRAFAQCVERGGRVRLLLAGRTDVPIAKRAGEHLYPRLLKRGVRIYEYQPQVLHAKLLIMDDILYIGSCNLDRRSLHINYELLVRLKWPELADDARRLFDAATKHSRPIEHGKCPVSAGRWQRLRARFAYWLVARVDPLIANRRLHLLG